MSTAGERGAEAVGHRSLQRDLGLARIDHKAATVDEHHHLVGAPHLCRRGPLGGDPVDDTVFDGALLAVLLVRCPFAGCRELPHGRELFEIVFLQGQLGLLLPHGLGLVAEAFRGSDRVRTVDDVDAGILENLANLFRLRRQDKGLSFGESLHPELLVQRIRERLQGLLGLLGLGRDRVGHVVVSGLIPGYRR